MATIDLTLNGIKIPALDGYTPPFGTKKVSGGLTTQEVNDNVIAPFVKERPIEITEDSSTGNIEYNASLVINSADAVLTLGSGTYVGCTVKVIAATAGSVSYNSGTTDTLAAGQIKTYIWTGSAWIDALGETQQKLTAGTGIDITGTTISASENLVSSQEIKTGKTYNGKPVYKMCISTTMPSSVGTSKSVSTGITDCAICLNYTATVNYGTSVISGNFYASTSNYSLVYFINSMATLLLTAGNAVLLDAVVIVTAEYTKTTD